MNIIKVNYNNAYIKVPKYIEPTFKNYVGRKNGEKYLFLNFIDNINEEPIYNKYQFDIYVEGNFVVYINEESQKQYIITVDNIDEKENIRVDVTGYYYNNSGMKQVIKNLVFFVPVLPICSNSLVCSENICVEENILNV